MAPNLLDVQGTEGQAMCLGIPGQVTSIEDSPVGMTMGMVNFGGITKRVCLAYVPDAQVGDYVLVHVGFAISMIDAKEAAEVFQFLDKMSELSELQIRQPA
jgi:hydrogenase expression/formation protein HypC